MGKRADNKAITPYKGSWADRINIDPLSKPKDHFEDAVILRKDTNERRVHRFLR
jgi:hypothetical protein